MAMAIRRGLPTVPVPGSRASRRASASFIRRGVPFTDHHVETELVETCRKRGLPLSLHKLDTLEAAQAAPSPATVFSLFINGRFVTTDLSACMDSRFDRVTGWTNAD